MAGGKESPRQKMISLMYLVLTAMLALNVDSAIINKFLFINESLQTSTKQGSINNDKQLKAMADLAKEPAAPPNAGALMSQANDIKTKSGELIAYIENLKTELIKGPGGDYEEGTNIPKSGSEITKVEEMMVGGSKNGKGYELKKKLEDFSDYIGKVLPEKPHMTYSGSEDPFTKGDPNQKNKDFVEVNFDATPMAAALAVLSQKQADVSRSEAEALTLIASKLGKVEIKPDKVDVGVEQEARYVAAGTKYKAEMFLSAGFSNLAGVSMTYNGSPAVTSGTRGKVEFTAQGGAFNAEGLIKRNYEAVIKFKTSSGKDTIFKRTIEYFVVKPSIEIQSASVKSLYINCGNDLSIQVPALGANYNPAFSAPGAQVIPGPKKGFITLVPSSMNEVSLTVSSGGNVIGTEKFPVRSIPRPQVMIFNGPSEVNQKLGVDAPGPASLSAKAKADEGFASAVPADARYRVQGWEITLVRGKRPVAGPIQISGDVANLSGIRSQARPGDRIIIEVKSVARMNFRGQIEPAKPAGTPIWTLPIN